MKRRQFIAGLGAAATWPLVARAQQATKRMRRVGALIGFAENDPATQRRVAAFLKGLADLGWVPDRDLTIDFRYGAGDTDRIYEGLDDFFALDSEILIASSPDDVLAALELEDAQLNGIANAARERVLTEHTGAERAREFEQIIESVHNSTMAAA